MLSGGVGKLHTHVPYGFLLHSAEKKRDRPVISKKNVNLFWKYRIKHKTIYHFQEHEALAQFVYLSVLQMIEHVLRIKEISNQSRFWFSNDLKYILKIIKKDYTSTLFLIVLLGSHKSIDMVWYGTQ